MFGRKRDTVGAEQVVLGMSEAELVALLGQTKRQSSTEDVLASYKFVAGASKLPRQRFLTYLNKPRGYNTDLVVQDGRVVRVRQTSRRSGEVIRDEEE